MIEAQQQQNETIHAGMMEAIQANAPHLQRAGNMSDFQRFHHVTL